MGDGE
jgi:hypothetical protein